jgi:hypothetical protein
MSPDLPPVDRDADELDEEAHRGELRDRHYGLLQELRVLLPGVQILLAFLLTAPFASGFERANRLAFGIALGAAATSVAALVSPIALHRFGDRRMRGFRLWWGIQLLRIGMVCFAAALLAALAVVVGAVYGAEWMVPVTGLCIVALGGAGFFLARQARRAEVECDRDREGVDARDTSAQVSSRMSPTRSVTRSRLSSWNATNTPSEVTWTSVST